MIITIDGIAASGKSSVSSGVAEALGIPYVSSGLFYRAVTLLVFKNHISPVQLSQYPPLLAQWLTERPIRLEPLASGNRVWLADEEVTGQLHATRIDKGVSTIAVIPEVRAWVDAQLKILPSPFVAEGRDMGTNVFPNAEAKFYLIASPRIRAERRSRERPENITEIEKFLISRDKLDKIQSAPAKDAMIIDTSYLSLKEVIDKIKSNLDENKI